MKLVARSTPLRCAFCHGPFRSAVLTCVACRTLIHEACELDRCPTLGCGSFAPWVLVTPASPAPSERSSPRRASWRRAAGRGVVSAVAVFAVVAPTHRLAEPARPVAPDAEPVGPSPPRAAPRSDATGDWTLEGVVLDERGAPLAGADVDLFPRGRDDWGEPPSRRSTCTTTTDARGRYRFRAPFSRSEHRTTSREESSGYSLVASAPGRQRDFTLFHSSACRARPTVEVHPLQLRPETTPAEGPVERVVRVVRDGQPVTRAKVRARGATGSWSELGREHTTDVDGLCKVFVPPSTTEVEVDLRDDDSETYLTCVAPIVSDGVTLVDLPCLTDRIVGRTNHHELRWPTEKTRRVSFESLDGRLKVEAYQDRRGEFVLAVPAYAMGVAQSRPASVHHGCGMSHPVPTSGPAARAPVMAGDRDVRLVLATGELAGRVVGAEGFAVPHARVRAHVAGSMCEVTADLEGRFALYNLPAGPVQLFASRHLLEGEVTVQVAGDEQEVVVTVR